MASSWCYYHIFYDSTFLLEIRTNFNDLLQGPKKKKKLTKEEKAILRAQELERIKKEEEFERLGKIYLISIYSF